MKKLKFENEIRKKETLFISKEDIISLNEMLKDARVSGVFLWTEEIK